MGVTAKFNDDGSITIAWQPVDGAKAYVSHYGGPGETGTAANLKGYSESTSFTLAAENVPAHQSGDTIAFAIQAFPSVGSGANDVEKAEDLNAGVHLGSEWSDAVTVTFE